MDIKEKRCSKCGKSQYSGICLIILILFLIIIAKLILSPSESKNITLSHGELLNFAENCTQYNDNNECVVKKAIIKAKITSSYNNKATINQNYFNVGDFIRKYEGTKYDEIQYWAVADMSNGEEAKVISFTIPKDLIKNIYNQNIADNQLENYLEDLYIHQSLKD